ncbi:unnamed protein product [Leptosia nina]|uniref:Uncharacterized protein n=1 Tax=Leptosia nina TaxID=320188 RepID=A0AAV1J5T7_9NEOP
MANIAREYLEESLDLRRNMDDINVCSNNEDLNKVATVDFQDKPRENESILTNSSSYVLARNDSQLSGDVDRWLRDSPTEVPIVRSSGVPSGQRTALTSTRESLVSNSFWYLAALVLPLFSANTYPQWRCSPNAILNTAGLLVTQVGHACGRVRCQIRRLTENTLTRDIFATAMDMILVVYAVGFLILSMYQASLIG